MSTFFTSLCDPFCTDIWVLIVRLVLAAVLGGAVGFERGFHGRAAGLRTHMLVSIGAALTAIIGVSVSVSMSSRGINSDAARISAQVISGIGFLGAGTILLKKGNSQIMGLTTAAGLWATAALGIAIGYGQCHVGAAAAVIYVLTFTVLSRLEFRLRYKRQRVFVYVEIDSVNSVKEIAAYLTETYHAIELSVTPPRSGTMPHVGIEALIRLPVGQSLPDCSEAIGARDHIIFVLNI